MSNRTSALKRARKRLNGLYAQSRHFTRDGRRSWHYVAREAGISVGTTIRIARDGYEPKDNRIRRTLGLPQYVMLQVCQKCGVVHEQRKSCSSGKSRRQRKPWVPPLLAAIRAAYREMTMEEVDGLLKR